MPNIHHEVLIAAPAKKVFDAITTQEGLRGWWAPDATAKPQRSSIARFPFGPTYFKEMAIEEFKPNQLVKWNCIAGADEWIGTRIIFKLESGNKNSLVSKRPEIAGQLNQNENSDELTCLIFHHDDWKQDSPMLAECSYTWAQFLRSLRLFVETGKGNPFPNQHRV